MEPSFLSTFLSSSWAPWNVILLAEATQRRHGTFIPVYFPIIQLGALECNSSGRSDTTETWNLPGVDLLGCLVVIVGANMFTRSILQVTHGWFECTNLSVLTLLTTYGIQVETCQGKGLAAAFFPQRMPQGFVISLLYTQVQCQAIFAQISEPFGGRSLLIAAAAILDVSQSYSSSTSKNT